MRAIDNYINGNLADAKAAARRVSFVNLYCALRGQYHKTEAAALAIARYLKGAGTFQDAANAESKQKLWAIK